MSKSASTSKPHEQSNRFHHNTLRYDPRLLAELERWWGAASEDADIKFSQIHGADALNFHQYCVFYERLVYGSCVPRFDVGVALCALCLGLKTNFMCNRGAMCSP